MPREICADDFLARDGEFDTVIDARSPGEFAHDHVPGAINLPVLDDAQRAEIGRINAQCSPFQAHRIGAAMVSENIAQMLKGPLAEFPRTWRPVVYCWRGGQRSGSLATILARVGWQTHVINGGYMAWRRAMRNALDERIANLRLIVLAGRTGAGKSRILQAMAAMGAQVLDLEGLAAHRGSVLGSVPGEPQPSQKLFESRLWNEVRNLEPARPVWVESESRTIGAVQVPEKLILAMRAATCVPAEVPRDTRATLLMQDYAHLIAAPDELKRRLAALKPLHGQAILDDWNELIDAGHWHAFVERLLAEHYDPAYDRSMARNYLSSARTELALTAPSTQNCQALIEALASQAIELESTL